MTITMTIGTYASINTLVNAADVTAADADIMTNVNNLANALQSVEQLRFDQIVTPANPAANKNKLYFKSGDHLCVLNSAGVETQLDSSFTQDNLIPNSSFEVWEHGASVIPDNWQLIGLGATVVQESTIVYHGNYSAKLTRVGNDCQFSVNMYNRFGRTYIRNKVITFSAWVYATAANFARLFITDGVTVTNSAFHPGTSAWVKLSVTATMGAAISTLFVGLEGDTTNSSAYLDAVMISEGSSISNYTPDSPVINEMPKRATMWHDEATVLTGNLMAASIDTTAIYNGTYLQTPSANGDSFSHSFFLQAGTYQLSVLGKTGTALAKIDWYVDNVIQASLTGQDWYSASSVPNVVKNGSVTVIGDGYHVLKGVVNGRNVANVSAFNIALTKYWIKPVVD